VLFSVASIPFLFHHSTYWSMYKIARCRYSPFWGKRGFCPRRDSCYYDISRVQLDCACLGPWLWHIHVCLVCGACTWRRVLCRHQFYMGAEGIISDRESVRRVQLGAVLVSNWLQDCGWPLRD
jgi:hypothetical protein